MLTSIKKHFQKTKFPISKRKLFHFLKCISVIDTIVIRLNGNYHSTILNKNIIWKSEKVDLRNGILSKCGNLKNMCIVITDFYIKITGSIAEFLGSLIEYSIVDFRKGIELLEATLGICLKDAEIIRIDIAGNMEMQNKPKSYFQFLGSCHSSNRFIEQNSLYYNFRVKKYIFYDKGIQMKQVKRIVIPFKNYLRFEVRYKKGEIEKMAKYWELFSFTIAHLYNDEILGFLIHKWKNEFDSIVKIDKSKIEFLGVNGVKDLELALLKKGIASIGGVEVLEQYIKENPNNIFTALQRFHFRKKIKSLIKYNIKSKRNFSIEELNTQIENEANKQLSYLI